MQSTFSDGMQVTRAVGTVLAYSIVAIVWLVMGNFGELNHRICHAGGVLQISSTLTSCLVGVLCVCAGAYSTYEAIRLGRKGETSHPAAHCIFILLGLMLIYDRAMTSATLGPELGSINNGAFAAKFDFKREELERVRQAPHSASGPSMPALELDDGRRVQLNWDPLPRAALTNFISKVWGVDALEHDGPFMHLNCGHNEVPNRQAHTDAP